MTSCSHTLTANYLNQTDFTDTRKPTAGLSYLLHYNKIPFRLYR